MRGRPPTEVRLPIPAVAAGFADFAEADNTEAKVMRPNVTANQRAAPMLAKLKPRTGPSG